MENKYYKVSFNKVKSGKLFDSYFTEYPDCDHFIIDLLNLGYQKIFVYEIIESKNEYSYKMIEKYLF